MKVNDFKPIDVCRGAIRAGTSSADPVRPLRVVVQNVGTFRLSWRSLHNPERYALSLITSPDHFTRLKSAGELAFFERVIVTDNFSASALQKTVQSLMGHFGTNAKNTILASNDEYCLFELAKARETLKISGDSLDQVRPFTNKVDMKKALLGSNIRMPEFKKWEPTQYLTNPGQVLTEFERKLNYPMFAKPLSEAGSVGTCKLESRTSLEAWCDAHTGDDDFEIDEFITGNLYHCDSLISKGERLFSQVSRYAYPCFDYLAGKPCASLTLPINDAESIRVLGFNDEVLAALSESPPSTATHLEVFWTPKNELVFVEIAARSPGAFVVPTYEKRHGFNLEEMHFRGQFGLPVALPKTLHTGPFAAWLFFPPRAGTVSRFLEPVTASEYHIDRMIQPGQTLQEPASVREQAATMRLWHPEFSVLQSDFNKLAESTLFSTQEEDNVL